MFRGIIGRALRLRKVAAGRDFYQRRQIRLHTETLGNSKAEWTIAPGYLKASSIVYSVGVGTDISFDLALIGRYRVKVYAFDPTPKSIEWIKTQSVPEGFVFSPYGLSSRDEETEFFLPANENFVSGSMKGLTGNSRKVNVTMRRLSTIMKSMEHNKIDILKMDIEGAEYEVIDELVIKKPFIKQLLIEFHHRFPAVGVRKTKEAIQKLNSAGYKIFHVSPSGEEMSFINTAELRD